MFERRFRFVDVDRADKHVIRNGRQQAVEQIKQRQLRVRRGLQDKLDHRREQLLIDDNRDDGEEDRQQRGKGQRLGERLANGVLIGNAGKGGGEDDHRQANQADLSQVKSQGHDQPNANERLGNQPQSLLTTALGAAAIVKLLQHLAHRRR